MGRITVLDDEAIDKDLGRDEEIVCEVQTPYLTLSTAGPYQGKCRFQNTADFPDELANFDGAKHDYSIVATTSGKQQSGRIMNVKGRSVIFKTVQINTSASPSPVP